MTKVVSIQYPSGGFGHFVHVVLSTYSKQFNCQKIKYSFGPGGDSHAFPTQLPKYHQLKDFDVARYYQRLKEVNSEYVTVLIDSGIDNDSDEYLSVIQPDKSIRIFYDQWTWPLLAQMFFTRCMSAVEQSPQTIDQWIAPELGKWEELSEPWAIREKFFLYLRDHSFRHSWRENNATINVPVDHVLEYGLLERKLKEQFELDNFEVFYREWYQVNCKYFDFFLQAKQVWHNLHKKVDISHVTDIFTQAVINYYIWLEFGFEVPHNDYANWFTNTQQIIEMLNQHNVNWSTVA